MSGKYLPITVTFSVSDDKWKQIQKDGIVSITIDSDPIELKLDRYNIYTTPNNQIEGHTIVRMNAKSIQEN